MNTHTNREQVTAALSTQNFLTNDSLFDFKRCLLKIVSKFGTAHTVAIGWEEVRKFMATEITDHEHMQMFLSILSESNDHMKP
jgi:hypothetical protein